MTDNNPFQVIGDLREEHWIDEALCAQADPDAWFPVTGSYTLDAKRVCRACPVREECDDYAETNRIPHGIWGGYTEKDRRKRRAGVDVDPFRVLDARRDPTYDSEVERLRAAGMSQRAIAERLGITQQRVGKICMYLKGAA